jgi:hypothetical protein
MHIVWSEDMAAEQRRCCSEPIGFTCKKVNRVWACFQNLCHLLFVFVDESMIWVCVEKRQESQLSSKYICVCIKNHGFFCWTTPFQSKI